MSVDGLYYYNNKGEKVALDPKAMSNAIIQERQEEEEQEEVEITRDRLICELTENDIESMSSKDIFRLIYNIKNEKSNAELLEEYNECHANQVAIISDSFDIDTTVIDEDNARDIFMQIFRSNELCNTLSVDDRIEVFSTILLGSSDFTAELLNNILSDYCVENLEVREITEEEIEANDKAFFNFTPNTQPEK